MAKLHNQELVAIMQGYGALHSRFNEFLVLLNTTISNTEELSALSLSHEEGSDQAILNFLGKKFRIYFDILNREHRYLGILEAELLANNTNEAFPIYKIYFDSQGEAFHTFDGVEAWEDLSDERFVWRVLYRISHGYFELMRERIGFLSGG